MHPVPDLSDAALAGLAEAIQRLADADGEAWLLLTKHPPAITPGDRAPYGVAVSRASGWERANALRRLEPRAG